MRTKEEIQEKAEWCRLQIRQLKEMIANRKMDKYNENLQDAIYHFADELTLLKWVLKEDQNETD